MQSKAATVEEYLNELPEERRAAISEVRRTIRQHLPKGIEEGMMYGMIGYFVPHTIYPAGYHCDPGQPLPFAALASQKNHMAVYLCSLYQLPEEAQWIRGQFASRGKRLDMGKSCIRFRKIEDLPLDVIGEAVRRFPAAEYIARYEAQLAAARKRKRKKR